MVNSGAGDGEADVGVQVVYKDCQLPLDRALDLLGWHTTPRTKPIVGNRQSPAFHLTRELIDGVKIVRGWPVRHAHAKQRRVSSRGYTGASQERQKPFKLSNYRLFNVRNRTRNVLVNEDLDGNQSLRGDSWSSGRLTELLPK